MPVRNSIAPASGVVFSVPLVSFGAVLAEAVRQSETRSAVVVAAGDVAGRINSVLRDELGFNGTVVAKGP